MIAGAYRLFARLLAREIDGELLATLRQPDILATLDTAQPGCREYLERPWTREEFEQAAVDYCALFILPEGVSTLASAWLPGADPNKAASLAALVIELESDTGIKLPDEIAMHPPEHLARILYLAAALPDETSLGPLAPWLPEFASALADRASDPLYRALGAALRELAGPV